MAPQLTLEDFRNSKNGQFIARWLNDPKALEAMKTLSRAGRPAIIALDAALPSDVSLGKSEKQHAGRMIRDHMNEHNWRVSGQPKFRGGRVFESGSVYKPANAKAGAGLPDNRPSATTDFETRLRWAQELVRRESKNNYSVDDFIRDRRAEAAREDQA